MRFRKLKQFSNNRAETIQSLAWSADGTLLATGTRKGTIFVWNAGNGNLRQKLEGHVSSVTALAWSSDGTLASAGKDPAILIWDLRNGNAVCRFNGFSPFSCLTWRDTKTLVSGTKNGTLSLWSRESEAVLVHVSAHNAEVTSCHCFTVGQKGRLLSSSIDNTVNLWDDTFMERLNVFRPNFSCRRVAVDPDAGLVALHGHGPDVRIYDTNEFAPVTIVSTGFERVGRVTWNGSDEFVAVGDRGVAQWFKLSDNSTTEILSLIHI